MLATIPIDQIDNGQRLRDVSEATVEALVNSIADIGLLNPVTVYRKKILRGGWVDGYGLVAGLHRKTACERLGLVEIEANVLDLTDLECQIAECDENLCAPQLTSAERARFTKRRKEAYEALHPETRQHVAGGHAKHGSASDNLSFAAATAEATGRDERTVQRDAERGDKIADAALDLIRGTSLDTGVYLDKLKKLPVTEQIKAIKSDLAAAKQKADRDRARKDKRKLADRPLDDAAVLENQVAALVAAWNKASAEAREEFMLRVGIETGTEPTPQVEVPSGEAAAPVALPAVIPSESNEGQNLSEGGAEAEDGVASRPSASGGESAVGGDDMRIAVPAPAIQPETATRSLDDLAVQDGLKMSSDGKPATGLYSEGMNAGSDKGVTGGESAATPDTRTSIQRTMDEVQAQRAAKAAPAKDIPTLIRGWTPKQPRPAICLDHSCDSYGPDGFMPCHDCLRVARAA